MTEKRIYTCRVREPGSKNWVYVAQDGMVSNKSDGCKPLTRAEADKAKKLFEAGAKRAGRPIIAQIAIIPAYP